MKRIEWKQKGASIEMVKTVNKNLPFVVVVEGQAAKILTKTYGVGSFGVTSQQIKPIIAIAAIAAVAGLVLFALSRGYTVEGSATTPDGTKYKIEFRPSGTD